VTTPFLVPKVLPVKRQTPGGVIFSFIILGALFANHYKDNFFERITQSLFKKTSAHEISCTEA
jgi:hypothetical protein